MVAASRAMRRPSWFCEVGPVSWSLARVDHCGAVRSLPKAAVKMAVWRWLTLRRMKPICSSSE